MNEESKIKHSRRLHQKHNYVKKQVKIAKAFRLPVKNGEEHRFQDHAAINCGIPKCLMCSNPRRIWKERTITERSFEQTEKWIKYDE